MQKRQSETKTETKNTLSPYQAEKAEAQAVPVSRPAQAGEALLRLQRWVGNRAVQRLLVQRQEPEEEEELQMKPQAASLQRQELEEEEEELMLKPDSQQVGLEGGQVAPEVEAAIQRARSGGQPLERTVQTQMSDALGHDFSGVRVHTDSEADALNQQLSARAFTTGPDIFFKCGAYGPGSGGGRELIAHELSHVVQQGTGRVGGGGSGMTVRPTGDSFEQEADALSGQVRSSFNASLGSEVQRTRSQRSPADDGPLVQPGKLRQGDGDRFTVQRAIQDRVGPLPGPTACHIATLIWAVREAVSQNSLSGTLTDDVAMLQMATWVPRPAEFIKSRRRKVWWIFPRRKVLLQAGQLPAPGTVLFWDAGRTPTHFWTDHSAVVTGANEISGYGQGQVFAGADQGFTQLGVGMLTPGADRAYLIESTTLVQELVRLIRRPPDPYAPGPAA